MNRTHPDAASVLLIVTLPILAVCVLPVRSDAPGGAFTVHRPSTGEPSPGLVQYFVPPPTLSPDQAAALARHVADRTGAKTFLVQLARDNPEENLSNPTELRHREAIALADETVGDLYAGMTVHWLVDQGAKSVAGEALAKLRADLLSNPVVDASRRAEMHRRFRVRLGMPDSEQAPGRAPAGGDGPSPMAIPDLARIGASMRQVADVYSQRLGPLSPPPAREPLASLQALLPEADSNRGVGVMVAAAERIRFEHREDEIREAQRRQRQDELDQQAADAAAQRRHEAEQAEAHRQFQADEAQKQREHQDKLEQARIEAQRRQREALDRDSFLKEANPGGLKNVIVATPRLRLTIRPAKGRVQLFDAVVTVNGSRVPSEYKSGQYVANLKLDAFKGRSVHIAFLFRSRDRREYVPAQPSSDSNGIAIIPRSAPSAREDEPVGQLVTGTILIGGARPASGVTDGPATQGWQVTVPNPLVFYIRVERSGFFP